MGKYKITTRKGYDFFEVASALQKSIRRGLEHEAMYWAVELFNSNFAEYCWKRLRIIASEDVGLAEPGAALTVHALYQNHKLQAANKDDKNKPERLFLTHAVLLLCRARKSRLVDNTLIAFWNEHEHVHRPIPDYAYDKHNEQGRRQGRGWKHFFEEGTLLANRGHVPGEDEMRTRAMEAISSQGRSSLFGNEESIAGGALDDRSESADIPRPPRNGQG